LVGNDRHHWLFTSPELKFLQNGVIGNFKII
jgi:hypothetical protein